MTETHWWHRAACTDEDPEIFFPVGAENSPATQAQIAEAKAVCSACPVRSCCLDFAFGHGLSDGIFGGLTENERRSLKKRRLDPVTSA